VSADFDFSELDRLAADLGTVPAKTGPKIRQALEVTSRHVKDAWRDKLKGSISFKHLPGAVSYDVTTFQGFGASVFKSEIGFDKDKPQGALGTFSEFGKPNQPPMGFGHASLQENQGDFEKGLDIAIAQALKEAGL